MSYAHYWEWIKPIADSQHFSAWSADVSRLIQYLPTSGYNGYDPLVIRGFDGSGEPICTQAGVSLNGDGTHGQDFGHEGFHIAFEDLQQPDFFNSCKTAAKPYDLLVTAALLRFAHHFPDAIISSDGNAHAWEKPAHLCEQIFGQDGGAIPFTILRPNMLS